MTPKPLTIFERSRVKPIKAFFWELQAYSKFLYRYFPKRFLEFLEEFEAGKGVVVEGLVTKRGKYTRPFLHTGMTGLFLIGLILTPVLTQAVVGQEQEAAPGAILGLSVDEINTTTSVSVKPRDGVVTYIVQSGDTVSSIASKFDVSIDTIRWQNDLASINAIKPGDKLEIPPVTGMVHQVKRGETIYSIAKRYDIDPQQIVNWPLMPMMKPLL